MYSKIHAPRFNMYICSASDVENLNMFAHNSVILKDKHLFSHNMDSHKL